MSENIEKVDEIEEVDKPVEKSRFNLYRDAYLRQELSKINVKEGAEMETALKFINERTDDSDSNLDDVFRELKVRMRLNERRTYIDPTPLGGGNGRPRYRNGEDVGKEMFERLKRKGLI